MCTKKRYTKVGLSANHLLYEIQKNTGDVANQHPDEHQLCHKGRRGNPNQRLL